jgi:hypothetical protein
MKYRDNSGFISKLALSIDITSDWFQDLKIVVTQNLLEWMGYKGRDAADKQDRFSISL